MYISPPIAVLAILGVAFTGMAWLAPPSRDEVRVSVTFPTVTYKKLVHWGQEHASTDGRAPTVGPVMELFVISGMKNDASLMSQMGTQLVGPNMKWPEAPTSY